MCRRDSKKTGLMELSTFRHIFRSGAPYSIKLNWRGEPLLNKDLWLFIEYAKTVAEVKEVSLNTNLQLLTTQHITDFNSAKLDWIIVSIDGATKKTYESIRKGASFVVLLKNLDLLNHQFRGKVRIQICPQESNIDELSQWQFIFRGYADELRVGKLHDFNNSKNYNIPVPYSCHAPWQRLTIDYQGNIYPCPSDYEGSFSLGNVNKTSIKEAWNSPQLNLLRYRLSTYGRSKTSLCSKCSSYC